VWVVHLQWGGGSQLQVAAATQQIQLALHTKN
jgi:hypothetical protein